MKNISSERPGVSHSQHLHGALSRASRVCRAPKNANREIINFHPVFCSYFAWRFHGVRARRVRTLTKESEGKKSGFKWSLYFNATTITLAVSLIYIGLAARLYLFLFHRALAYNSSFRNHKMRNYRETLAREIEIVINCIYPFFPMSATRNSPPICILFFSPLHYVFERSTNEVKIKISSTRTCNGSSSKRFAMCNNKRPEVHIAHL